MTWWMIALLAYFYRKDFCPWCEKQPCPVLMEMVYPYGIEACNQCDWEAKDGE
jgi:hypothetical protein